MKPSRVSLFRVLSIFPLLALIGTVCAALGPLWWGFDNATSFRMQYLVVLLPSGGILLFRRGWKVSLLFLAPALVNLLYIVPLYIPRPMPTEANGPTIRVLSFNVLTSNQRYDDLLAYVKKVGPDLIVLQEVNDRWMEGLKDLKESHPHVLERPRADNFGIALFSRWPLSDSKFEYFGEADVPTIATKVRFDRAEILLLGTHPAPPRRPEYAEFWHQHLDEMAAYVKRSEVPVVVVGDMNASPWSPTFHRFLQHSGLLDTTPGFGFKVTWPTDLLLLWTAIDHGFVSPTIGVKNRVRGPHLGSDHYPLWFELVLPSSPSSPVPMLAD